MPTQHTALVHGHGPLVIGARCQEAGRTLRLLSGVMEAQQGRVFSRCFNPDGSAEMEVEFSRSLCVDIYCLVVAMGLELDRDSHCRLTVFCQCTRARLGEIGDEPVSMVIRIRESAPDLGTGPEAHDEWLLRCDSQAIYEA